MSGPVDPFGALGTTAGVAPLAKRAVDGEISAICAVAARLIQGVQRSLAMPLTVRVAARAVHAGASLMYCRRIRRFRAHLVLTLVVLVVTGYVSVSWAGHIAGSPCRVASSCAGHEFWPRMTANDVQRAGEYRGTTLRGRPGNRDELLGWHGSDTLYGGDQADVLWADHVGTGQPRTQSDRMYGGAGDDFLYAARGRNTISGGPGNDAIKARYGRGAVDCGPGRDIVHLPKSRRRNWTFTGCERFEYRSESAAGRGLKTLP